MNDPFGAAVKDYQYSFFNWKKKIRVYSSISGREAIPLKHLFRNYHQMPEIEKTALSSCSGKILDVGACAGSHALHLQSIGANVTALEISPGCCEVMHKRGVRNVICADIFDYSGEKFDSILLLMNGIGIAGTISGLEKLLMHLKSLLNPGGKIIFDSSDIDYAFYEADGSKWVDLNKSYYGEVQYTLAYKNIRGKPFNWLFIDSKKMEEIAHKNQFSFSMLAEGNHYDYLGLLKPKN
jgi:SAM-dependent methyltransferase